MEKAKDTKGKAKENATTVDNRGTCRENAPNRSKKAQERGKENHFTDGVTIAINKDMWREIAKVEKEV